MGKNGQQKIIYSILAPAQEDKERGGCGGEATRLLFLTTTTPRFSLSLSLSIVRRRQQLSERRKSSFESQSFLLQFLFAKK